MATVGLCILVFLTCSVSQIASEVYHITAAESSSSCTVPCLNLSQFMANSRQYLNLNVSLVFLPGTHHLHVNLSVSNLEKFSMNSERMRVQIVCTRHSNVGFKFSNIEYVHIANIEFIGCGGNQIKNIQQFTLEDAEFKGQEGSNTALELTETSAQIVGSMFTHNTMGKSKGFQVSYYYIEYRTVGGAIIATGSEIDISKSKFQHNAAGYGGAIYARQYSTIHLKDNVFVNNTATSHGGVLDSSDSSITIEASTFHNNAASEEGGVLYSLNDSIKVEGSSFANNTVITPKLWYRGGNGGVFSCFRSNISVEASKFTSNIVYSNGGVFHLSQNGNVTIKASVFDNNVARKKGAVLYASKSSISIDASQFKSNTAYSDGAVLVSDSSSISVNRSAFSDNTALNMGGVQFSSTVRDINISHSNFTNNSSPIGAVIHSDSHPTNEIYYITPDLTNKLCTSPCLTLSQFAIDSRHSLNSNITLVFLPGRHHLIVRLMVSYLDNFFMYSENSTTQIVCTRDSHIFFKSSQHVHVKSLTFLGCGDNEVQNVERFVLQDAHFKAQGYRRRALKLQEATAWIIDGYFVDYQTSVYGGTLSAIHSKIFINRSSFQNSSALWGGAISAEVGSMVVINETIFYHNACEYNGGVIHSTRSTVIIEASEFNGNTATGLGGMLYSSYSNITIKASRFANNRVFSTMSRFRRQYQQQNGGVLYCVGTNVTIEKGKFNNNTANNAGGVLYFSSSNVKIEASDFSENNARGGGVLISIDSTTAIESSNFSDNTVTSFGGVVHIYSGIVTIEASDFHNNLAQFGGALYTESYCKITVDNSIFTFNRAARGAVVYAKGGCKVNCNTILVSNNSALEYGVIYIVFSEFIGVNAMVSNNLGSLVVFSGNITLGNVKLQNNQSPNAATVNFQEGGTITLLQSNAFFGKSCTLELNNAEDGGAIFSTESKLYLSGNVTIAHNRATRNGGGIYLLNSELNCQQGSISALINNTASQKGGGIHAISSFIKVSYDCQLRPLSIHFERNAAKIGGALSLEANTKLYILKYLNNKDCANGHSNDKVIPMILTGNTADYGGAMYVDDDSNSGSCARVPRTECIFQVIAVHNIVGKNLNTRSIAFSDNTANISGSTMYGGLLDRCGVSQFAEVNNKHEKNDQHYEYKGNGVAYFKDVSFGITNISTISSRPVHVCLCVNNKHNCTYQTYISVKKGEAFTLSLATVDQLHSPVEGVIQTSLNFTESGLAEGQLTREILGECSDMEFNVFSPHDTEELTLYALDGPCKDAELSRRKVPIRFLPCSCPLGFQALEDYQTSCTCDCHRNISQYVECDINTGTFVRHSQSRVWISHVNDTKVPGFIIYSNCPFDYCNQLSLPVDLNQPSGSDVQCAFNRSSMLCGSCRPHLSLSLGSSLCLSCPTHWSALFITITTASLLAGIALVALLLVLNMTVAVGTLNGLIFYANILYSNKSIFFLFQKANFIITFVSWLNLDIGIDTCYFPGMDTYTKTWLQFAFPAYVILLVGLVIILSSYSSRFSNLIGRRNPVATLATLVLLSYAKLLETCFKSLSFGYVTHPDGFNDMLWLPDGNVKYLFREHIPLFTVAILILLIGLVYTTLLFTWQWLVKLPEWRIFKWSRNQRLHTFIETYHAPYTFKHRYWTGLLLLVRLVLYLTAAVNFSNDPHVALTAIIVTVSCIILLGRFIASRVYRKCPLDTLETFFHLNILFFALFTWYSLNNNAAVIQEAAAYTSVIITFITLLLIILYHILTFTTVFSKVKKTMTSGTLNSLITKTDPSSKAKQSPPPDDDVHGFQEMIACPINTNDFKFQQKPEKLTYSVVEVLKPRLASPAADLNEDNTQETSCSAEAI